MIVMYADIKKEAVRYSKIFYRKGDMLSGVLNVSLIILSLLCAIYSFFASGSMPSYYGLLWMLPTTYAICMIFSKRIIKEALQSLPILLIGALFFVRMVLSPFLYAYAGIKETITINVDENTTKAILIMCYECLVVFAILNWCCRKNWGSRCLAFYLEKKREKGDVRKNIDRRFSKGDKRLLLVLAICGILLGIFYAITPHIFDVYRTIFDVGDANFASVGTEYYIRLYGKTFMTKFAMVASNYMMLVLRIFVPAVIIYWSAKIRRKVLGIVVAIAACLSPFLMIDRAIARSFYTPILLAYEVVYIYWPKNQKYKMLFIFAFGACLILFYWIIRYAVNNTGNASLHGFFQSFSGTVNAYFSGVNVVSGAFNMPNDLSTRINCIMHDILEAIPFSGTIFGIDDNNSQVIFNMVNGSVGQIPTTVGLSSYYFTPFLAPLISVIFTYFAYNSGIKYDLSARPLKKVCYLFVGLYLALGLVMYNFPISFGSLVQNILPMFIIERVCYGKERIK